MPLRQRSASLGGVLQRGRLLPEVGADGREHGIDTIGTVGAGAALVETTINLGLRVAAYRNGQARQPSGDAPRREPVDALPLRARWPEIEPVTNIPPSSAQCRGRRRIGRAI